MEWGVTRINLVLNIKKLTIFQMKLLVVLVSMSWVSWSFAIPILIFDGDEVTAASNISVEDQTFLVEFKDGAFVDLYPDGIDPIFFQNVTNVVAAATQIGDAFDTDLRFHDADQIRGCESVSVCGILFPFDVFGNSAQNALFGITDTGFQGFSAFDAFAAETRSDNLVFAVVTIVPIPAAAWLFGSALVGLGVVRKRLRV